MQIEIIQTSFQQAYKYMILIQVNQETKRTDLCQQCTSVPKFKQKILFQNIGNLMIKVCEATIDRKLKIVGTSQIQLSAQNNTRNILWEDQIQITNQYQNKIITIGRCYLRIKNIMNVEKDKQNNIEQSMRVSKLSQFQQEDFQMKSQSGEQNCNLRFHFHYGCHFYLGISLQIILTWGTNSVHTKPLRDKINPKWAETLAIAGCSEQQIKLQIQDQHHNKLQWVKFNATSFRLMHPYHLCLYFRQQCMGSYPQVYFTVVRQDIPLFRVIEKKIICKVKNCRIQSKDNPGRYLLIMQRIQFCKPQFLPLQMKKYFQKQKINQFLNQMQASNYNWIQMIPITNQNCISLLKSFLNKNLTVFLIELQDFKTFFTLKNSSSFRILQKKQKFENVLRKVFYHNQVGHIGKQLVIVNENYDQGKIEGKKETSQREQWQILTHNYTLRNDLINQSIKNITIVKQNIENKGQQLTALKKILTQVKQVNGRLKKKSQIFKHRKKLKQFQNYKQWKVKQLTQILFYRQQQLQDLKQKNYRLIQQIIKNNKITQHQQKLDGVLLRNSHELIKQQKKIKNMSMMRKTIPKQKQLISKLQRVFQKKQIDKQANQILKQQQQTLRIIRKNKRNNLQNIFQIIKNKKGKQSISMPQKIQQAQNRLQKLKLQYIQLVDL